MNRNLIMVCFLVLGLLCAPAVSMAQEVEKGKIPEDQLAATYKKLSWGAAVWDIEEAKDKLDAEDKTILWVDTRPASFFEKGTVRGAVILVYDKAGSAENTLTADSLAAAITKAGMTKDTAKIAFFCQGPKCHRSYNATHAAIKEWGYKAENVVWFRAGYPDLLQAVKDDAKMKRKAGKYISDEGMKDL